MPQRSYEMRCAIWYHFCKLEIVKNTHGGALLLEPTNLLKVTLIDGCFVGFFKSTNGTKSRNATHFLLIL